MNEIELLIFIITRGRGDELIRLSAQHNISFSLIMHGRGTVSSNVLDMLGLEGPEKDVVLLSVEKERADAVMTQIASEMKLELPGGGVAFSIPFSALAGQFMSYELFAGTLEREKSSKGFKKLLKRSKGGD